VTPNLAAFLATVAHGEGVDRAPDPYRVCYAFRHTIADLSFHPAEPRPPDNAVEWKGESIANLGPQYAGEVSTAAGRYQLTVHTWLACKAALGLQDFGAASQNAAAVLLIRQKGALDDVQAGAIAIAIAKCRGLWASLPGGTSGQPQRTLAELLTRYTAAGGVMGAVA
jgi:lysozyme